MLKGGNGRLLLQALSKTMNIKTDRQSEKYIREMIRRNRLIGSPSELINKAIASFYKQGSRRGFKRLSLWLLFEL